MRTVTALIAAALLSQATPAAATDTYAHSATTCHILPYMAGSIPTPIYTSNGVYNDSTSAPTQLWCGSANELTGSYITSLGVDFCVNSTTPGTVYFPVTIFDWEGQVLYTTSGGGSGIGCYHEDIAAPGVYGYSLTVDPVLPAKNGNGVNKFISYTVSD
jgi:hypothetical protein